MLSGSNTSIGLLENGTGLNQSLIQLTLLSEQTYNYLYGDWLSRTLYLLLVVIILIFGPLFGTTMVLFERFGADSQKRTIINRLCSFVFINVSIVSFTWSLLRILRDNFGLLSSKLLEPIFILNMWLDLSSNLFITQITVMRFLYIVIWKQMKVINDEFWTSVLSKSSYLIIFYISLMHHVLGGPGYDQGQFIHVMSPRNSRYDIYLYIIIIGDYNWNFINAALFL